MDEKKVIRIPISYEQRKINENGVGYVPCQVSGRWLQFPEVATHEKHITVDVMTDDTTDGSHRKICGLILSKEDLMRAINSIKIEK